MIEFNWAWDIQSIQFGIAFTGSRSLRYLGRKRIDIGLGFGLITIWLSKGFLNEPVPKITQCGCILPKGGVLPDRYRQRHGPLIF